MRERINLFLWGIILFAAVQGIGILAGLKFKDYLECYQINFLRIYWWQFLILFGAVSLVIFNIPKITKILHRISRKMLKKKLNFLETKFNRFKEKIKIQSLWQIGFSILIGFVGFAATAMFFYYPYAIVFGIILAAAWVLISRVWYHNFSMMLLLVTFGIIFGFGLSCWSSLIILGSLAVYDLLAVYRFKFMVEFSKNMVKSGSILGFIIPRLKISDFNARLKEVSSNFKVNLSENKPERFSLTGGGDAGLPLVLTISVLVNSGLSHALIVAGFSIIGVIVVYLIYFHKKGHPLPALPPIAGFAIVGFLISSLI